MSDFGYVLLKNRHIDYEANDKRIAEYIYAREPSFGYCMECGCCAGTCTSGNFTHLSLREINILIKRGETSTIKEQIDKCMLCGKCTLVCPRGVNTRNIIILAGEAIQKLEANEL
ncbi:MAG: 4Fe-4S dicluster domain-containing protein [Bacteroidales bacterium]|jgi:heterodisulfide reductase subunit C|nr:4Fe-4S dicluster domain-containing protein [Bacteroidota bacterium]